jgi:hypothetical protein
MHITAIIYWRLFLNSNKALFAERFVKELQIQFGAISLLKMDIYWKDASLYEIEFSQKINTKDVAQLIYQTTNKATILSNNWNLCIPSDLENNYEGFSGVAKTITKVKGLKWASFSLEEQPSFDG